MSFISKNFVGGGAIYVYVFLCVHGCVHVELFMKSHHSHIFGPIEHIKTNCLCQLCETPVTTT